MPAGSTMLPLQSTYCFSPTFFSNTCCQSHVKKDFFCCCQKFEHLKTTHTKMLFQYIHRHSHECLGQEPYLLKFAMAIMLMVSDLG